MDHHKNNHGKNGIMNIILNDGKHNMYITKRTRRGWRLDKNINNLVTMNGIREVTENKVEDILRRVGSDEISKDMVYLIKGQLPSLRVN